LGYFCFDRTFSLIISLIVEPCLKGELIQSIENYKGGNGATYRGKALQFSRDLNSKVSFYNN